MTFLCSWGVSRVGGGIIEESMLTSLGWNAAVDFILAILPVTIIYKIKISMNKKIGICTLLSLGLL